MDGPKKRRAGPAGTGHGSKSKSKSQRKTTLRPIRAQASRRASLSVYCGQEWLGNIEVRDDGIDFAAFSTADRFLGSFASLKAAADAVEAASGGDA